MQIMIFLVAIIDDNEDEQENARKENLATTPNRGKLKSREAFCAIVDNKWFLTDLTFDFSAAIEAILQFQYTFK